MSDQDEPLKETVIDVETRDVEESSQAESTAVFCPQCGASMEPAQRFCSGCGWDAENPEKPPPGPPRKSPRELGPLSSHNRLTVLLLAVLIGWIGVHRFYVGRTVSGIVWLVTFGFLGIGVIYDLVLIATGEFRDVDGRRIWHWN